MKRVIVLDTFPLSCNSMSFASRGERPSLTEECQPWLRDCVARGSTVLVPAISYFESLRELERKGAHRQIFRLRTFCAETPGRYLSIIDADLDLAAQLWGRARNRGVPTADAAALDGDVILAAQALHLGLDSSEFVIATTNPTHLARYAPAELWSNITP